MMLIYTDYGYGHVDLTKHAADLEKPSEIVEKLML